MPEKGAKTVKFMPERCFMGLEMIPTKKAVSVAEMARMVSLSRARFYQLIGTAFPFPVYDVFTHRPLYVQEMQETCLEVRRKNCGIDGKPILFYARRPPITTAMKRKTVVSKAVISIDLLDSLKSLGLMVTTAQVQAAVTELFPQGMETVPHGDVVRHVFIHLQKKGSR
jgi:hypothetical protein